MTHSPCDKWDHPPTGFAPSSSSFRSGLHRRYTDGAFHGVYLSPSSRHQLPAAFICAKDPTPWPLCVLSVSHAFDAFRHLQPCGFISTHCHVQGSPSGVFAPHTAVVARRYNPAFSSFLRSRLHAVAHVRQLLRIRPQGFAPCENPRRFITVIHRDKRPIPSWFFLLQVFTRSDVPVPSHFLPPYTFMRLCRCHFRMWSLATVASIGLPFPRLPTCSRFGTFSALPLAESS